MEKSLEEKSLVQAKKAQDDISPRTTAVKRVLKRRNYREQQNVLRSGIAAATPGEEMTIAKAGFSSPKRLIPYKGAIEGVLGIDLSHVNAHIGLEAQEAAEAIGAEAYTVGTDMAFGSQNPKFDVVLHEAVHVAQQTSAHGDTDVSSLEKEADVVSATKKAGISGHRVSPSAPRLLKKEKLPSGKEGFERMWDAHPHNYQADSTQNTSSDDLAQQHGFPAEWNTCAIRLSIMLNRIGLTITPEKTKAAGISRNPYYSRKTRQYYILSAKEMLTYLTNNFRKADRVFPAPNKRYRNNAEFMEGFNRDISKVVQSRKGIVMFEGIFTYQGGSRGHVDLFDGLNLSDAPGWYDCERLHLWFVQVPKEEQI